MTNLEKLAFDCEDITHRWRDVVEKVARYMENDSQCFIAIVTPETKHDYGVRVIKALANELRSSFELV